MDTLISPSLYYSAT